MSIWSSLLFAFVAGWKTPDESRKGDVENNYIPKFSEECRNQNCQHSLENHISHLSDITDEQTFELLGAVVDVENLYMSMHNEKDDDTKKVYYFLFRVCNYSSAAVFIPLHIVCLSI